MEQRDSRCGDCEQLRPGNGCLGRLCGDYRHERIRPDEDRDVDHHRYRLIDCKTLTAPVFTPAGAVLLWLGVEESSWL